MKLNWNDYLGKTLNVTMHENFGMVFDPKSGSPIYEIVFKTGKLIGAFDDGILLENIRDQETVRVYIPYQSIKCVDIFNY